MNKFFLNYITLIFLLSSIFILGYTRFLTVSSKKTFNFIFLLRSVVLMVLTTLLISFIIDSLIFFVFTYLKYDITFLRVMIPMTILTIFSLSIVYYRNIIYIFILINQKNKHFFWKQKKNIFS